MTLSGNAFHISSAAATGKTSAGDSYHFERNTARWLVAADRSGVCRPNTSVTLMSAKIKIPLRSTMEYCVG